MEKGNFDYEPSLVTDEGKNIRICFDVEHATEERIPMGGGEPEEVEVIRAYSVRVDKPVDRSRVINTIVTAEYPEDRMDAVINNYLLDPEDVERKAEFQEMQAWRAHAKEIATEVMEELNN